MSLISRFFAFYSKALETRPLVTKSITSGTLFFGGDVICQVIEEKGKAWNEWKMDWGRALRITIFGTAVLGPAGHYWYKFLDHRFPQTTWKVIAIKVGLDQACFSPPFYATFFTVMPLLEGHTPSEAITNVKQKFIPTIIADLIVWPPAQAVNFRFVGPQYRLLFVSSVSVGWNAFLSWMQHGH